MSWRGGDAANKLFLERSRRMDWYGGYGDWAPYVPVARRRANAVKFAARLAKKEKRAACPVKAAGRKMSNSFWGQAWCDNLEQYSDYSNRLPRGRTYARNGSVVDLQIDRGKIRAIVAGSDVYRINIKIKTLASPHWNRIKQDCSQSINSLIDLLQGKFDQGVMQRLTQRDTGLFPKPAEIEMDCSCPDSAGLCKHLAATMYCVGVRLDAAPELLFTLRAVDHLELIGQAVAAENLDRALGVEQEGALSGNNLGEIFGIELDASETPAAKPTRRKRSAAAKASDVVFEPPSSPIETPRPTKPRRKKAAVEKPAPKESAVAIIAKPKSAGKRASTKRPAAKRVAIKRAAK
jgi:uncharacterized Zn finger protein